MKHQSSNFWSEPGARLGPVPASSLRSAALLMADIAAFALASCLAFLLHVAVDMPPFTRAYHQVIVQGLAWYGWGTFLVLAVLLAYFGSRGHYSGRIPSWTEIRGVLTGVTVAFLCDVVIRYGVYHMPSAFESIMRWVLLIPSILILRRVARIQLDALGLWKVKTLIIGDSATIDCARDAIGSEPALGYDVMGTISLRQAIANQFCASPRRALEEYDAEFVVLTIGGGLSAEEARIIDTCTREKIAFALVPAFDGLPVSGISNHYFLTHDVLLLVCNNNLARPISRMMKAVFDQIVAALLIVLLSPLLLVMIAIIRADGGPALFGHARIGENGRKFRCLKFRTMVTDADAVLQRLLLSNEQARREWEETQKLRDDPRVTRIGRALRKTSLDELPQLLNVLRGEMSLVGPRPIVDAEVPRYGRDISYYLETRPGITGLWQVSGRSNTSYEHRVRLDVWYVRNWTLWHDVAILLKTIPAVLLKDGAV